LLVEPVEAGSGTAGFDGGVAAQALRRARTATELLIGMLANNALIRFKKALHF
jgi:hypothetical protein